MGRGKLLLVMAALVAALCAFPAAASAQDDGPDGEVVDLLKQLIRTNTSNPPGNERQIAELLQARLAPLGFETEIVPTPTAGKAHFIARLRAANPTAKPLLLAGHEDVVGVERDLWSVDPFAGLVRGGNIFGRGAMDFKGGLAAFTVAASRLARAKVALKRDIILLAEADEEGGDYGTGWLAKTNFAKIDAGVSLNEGGWVFEDGGGTPRLMGITTIDKNSLSVTLKTRGTSTHSSRPLPDSALARLTRALNRIERYEPATPKLSTRSAATCARGPAASAAAARARSARCCRAHRQAAPPRDRPLARGNYGELFNGLLRTIYVPTIADGGFRSNVLPGTAEATVNIRLLPGARPRPAIRELRRVIGEQGQGHADRHHRRVGERDARALREARQAAALEHRHRPLPRAGGRGQARVADRPRHPALFEAGTDAVRGASAASRSTASTRIRSRAPSWPTCTATTSTSRSAASKRGRTCSRASSAPPPPARARASRRSRRRRAVASSGEPLNRSARPVSTTKAISCAQWRRTVLGARSPVGSTSHSMPSSTSPAYQPAGLEQTVISQPERRPSSVATDASRTGWPRRVASTSSIHSPSIARGSRRNRPSARRAPQRARGRKAARQQPRARLSSLASSSCQLTARHEAATANSASPTGGHARRLSAAKACSSLISRSHIRLQR